MDKKDTSQEIAMSLFNDGVELYEKEEFILAERKLKKALELMPSSEDIFYNLALVYFELEDYEQSWEFVNKIKDLDCQEIIIELKKVGFLEDDINAKISILEISKKIIEKFRSRVEKVGEENALMEPDDYSRSMWFEYNRKFSKPVVIMNANFSKLLFKQAQFYSHYFFNCNFNGSHFEDGSTIWDSCCAESNFSNIRAIFPLPIFNDTDCHNCNFTNSKLYINPYDASNYKNANFTNAHLMTDKSFFENPKKKQGNFENATMNNCLFTISVESNVTDEKKNIEIEKANKEIRPHLIKIFGQNQLASMRVEYELIKQKSGCFIATITCGINSNEVNILQNYRDEILLKFILGRILIKLYYLISPLLVLMIKESIFLKNFVRSFFIIPLIKLIIRKRIQ